MVIQGSQSFNPMVYTYALWNRCCHTCMANISNHAIDWLLIYSSSPQGGHSTTYSFRCGWMRTNANACLIFLWYYWLTPFSKQGFNRATQHYITTLHGLLLPIWINFDPTWISNYVHYIWYEITYPYPNFNGCTREVRGWISNLITDFMGMWLYIHAGIEVNRC